MEYNKTEISFTDGSQMAKRLSWNFDQNFEFDSFSLQRNETDVLRFFL